jgi:hypothetical protein
VRRGALLLALILALAPVNSVNAGSHKGIGFETDEGVRAGVPGSVQPGSGGGQAGVGGGQAAAPEVPPTIRIGGHADLVGLPGGGRCVRVVPRDDDSGPNAVEEQRILDLAERYGWCPTGPDGEEFDPGRFAEEVWVQLPLAQPQPYIAPGWGLVGKAAYLETNSRLEELRTEAPTPLGQLRLRARSHYVVDWGDGTVDGYDVEGGPWPDGAISHVYRHAGGYTVVVRQVWSAQWQLGGSVWVDIALTRDRAGAIEPFEVREVQAIRNR